MTVVNKCRPANLDNNQWCLKDLFSLGEGTDLAFLPATAWGAMKQRWMTTAAGETSPMILAAEAGSSLMSYIYNEPKTTPETTLFPTSEKQLEGLYFAGNSLIFNPTIGNATQANGVPYQTSNFTLPIGSSRTYDELAQYLQSKAWVAIKLSASGTEMHVYGGPRGYLPKADEVSEMMFSGNNETKGETTASFAVDKANYAVEYITVGAESTNANALTDLMGYIKEGACMENGVAAK